MKKISNEFINLSKKIKTQDLKLTINDGELTVQEVHLMPVNIFNAIPISRLRARKEVIAKELKYSFEGQLFKTIMQQIEITVKNANEIKGKNVDFKYGILINNEFEYIDMGEYYIKDIEDDKNKEELIVTGYDKMLNFMKPFKQSDLQLIYPCEMKQLVKRIGEVCGVDLYSMNFFNSDLVVEEDFFTVQQLTYRDVLEKIAQTTLTTIFIKENKLYLCKIEDSVQILDTSFLSNLVIGEKFGPVNTLVLGRGSVEDNIESINQQSINSNGRCEIRFDENEFLDNKREQVIDEMLQQISGLEYYAIEASNLGLLWLEPCDVIITKDREENEYKTIYLKASVTINTGIKGEMEADIPDTTNTEYKVTTKEEKKTLKVERLAKKNEGLIKDIIEETSENSQKLTQVEQTMDSIKDTIKSVETKAGTAQSIADIATTKANNAQTTANTANTNAQNAQKTANENTTRINTTTTKITEVEETVNGITQSVSSIEEKIETVEDKAGTAQTTANTAKNNAQTAQTTANNAKNTVDEINTNLTTNYYTKTETNAQIQTKADSITSSVSKIYSTKTETQNIKTEAVNEANNNTSEKLEGYTKVEELGTQIEQNWEHVKYAWNQISEFIQLMILNNNASFAILDESKNLLMSLDKQGQHFYKDEKTIFGEMGVKTINNENYISFSVPTDYDNSVQDGMAWGVTTKSDNKFWPILYIKNFTMPPKGSDGCMGELILSGCNLILDSANAGIVSNRIKIHGDAMPGIFFSDSLTGELLFYITPENAIQYASVSILDNIRFYKNQAGSNSFKIGNGNNYCLFTDDGTINCNNISADGDIYATGYVSGISFQNTSLAETKKNIKSYEKSALNEIMKTHIYSFNYKAEKEDTKKTIGAVIGNEYSCSSEILSNDNKAINIYTMISLAYKAIQEQQEQIELLKEKDKQKDKIIEDLIKRIEILEKGGHR